jgi:hypothetical protein
MDISYDCESAGGAEPGGGADAGVGVTTVTLICAVLFPLVTRTVVCPGDTPRKYRCVFFDKSI